MRKKVSIVVPVFNSKKYIMRCVSSILSQSYDFIGIILVDDGSTDGSTELCDRLGEKDERVTIIHQNNMGVSSARNAGIQAADGEWLMFVDADDWIDAFTVEAMVSLLQNTNANLGIFTFKNVYSEDRVYTYEISECDMNTPEFIESLNSFSGVDGMLCSVCNKMYKLQLIKSSSRFIEGIRFGEDFIFNTCYLKSVSRIASINRPLYYYDCSIESSGVKKWYSNYPEYITNMELELRSLMEHYDVINDEFVDKFIGDRWKYAVEICINSSIFNKEAAITELVKAIPERYWANENLLGRKMQLLYQVKCGYIDAHIALRAISRKEMKRLFVIRIKQWLKKALT